MQQLPQGSLTLKAARTPFQATLRGCFLGIMVVVMITIVTFGYFIFRVSKMPQYQTLQQCSEHTITIKSAIDRYKIRHTGKYPARLMQLEPFLSLQDRHALYCPLEHLHKEPSYNYTALAPDSSDDTILLSCDRHTITLMKQSTPIRVYITVGGKGGVKRLDAKQLSRP